MARGSGADCVLTMVAGRVRFAARARDRARLAEWQAKAAASVAARAEAAPAAAVEGLQAALAAHYAARAEG
jgi:5-methylthioadenosine/S-adenosylhomocysteine deaminase